MCTTAVSIVVVIIINSHISQQTIGYVQNVSYKKTRKTKAALWPQVVYSLHLHHLHLLWMVWLGALLMSEQLRLNVIAENSRCFIHMVKKSLRGVTHCPGCRVGVAGCGVWNQPWASRASLPRLPPPPRPAPHKLANINKEQQNVERRNVWVSDGEKQGTV